MVGWRGGALAGWLAAMGPSLPGQGCSWLAAMGPPPCQARAVARTSKQARNV